MWYKFNFPFYLNNDTSLSHLQSQSALHALEAAMDAFPAAFSGGFASLPPSSNGKVLEPDTEVIKQRLIRKGVVPTPKILHTLRKKEIQKYMRRTKKLNQRKSTLTEVQMRALEEDTLFRKAKAEYRVVMAEVDSRREPVGRPWKRASCVDIMKLGSEADGFLEKKLKVEHLEELRKVFVERNAEILRGFIDDADVESFENGVKQSSMNGMKRRESIERMSDDEKIQLLARRLSSTNLSIQDWKFSRLMKYSGLLFSEMCMLEILEELGALKNWKQALSVVKWVYNQQEYKNRKSRFVYTKLLSVLGKERRHREALKIFNEMREDGQIYPDMAAYHSIAVTLGQAGLVEELILLIERMMQKPSKKLRNMNRKDWDPCLDPDIIIYNALLNACVSSRQWKGVSWVLHQMRFNGLRPTETTYGLAMEVMLKAGKYDDVHKFFEKMQEGRLAPKAISYKVLVRTFWEQGKVDEAVAAVRDMERRGVIGIAAVYYELACCLCNKGRWLDATMEVEKLRRLPHTKPLEVTFTGMILASLDGGYVNDCISIYEFMKDYCTPNIGTINAMLKVYGRSDMFAKAKHLFESIKKIYLHSEASAEALEPDAFTFSTMLEACASACQWEFFEYVYKEMALYGYSLEISKHSWLLVEASKAGKWHLLEHAFNTCLESGEIPHISLFTEMLCQTIIQQKFDRINPLLNGMAHASLQFSESQWLSFLQRNNDRFGLDALKHLLTHLHSSNLVMEQPIPDLLRSLESLCGGGTPTRTAILASSKDISTDYLTFQEKKKKEEMVRSEASVLRLRIEERECDSLLDMRSEILVNDSIPDQLTDDICTSSSRVPLAADILQSWKDDRCKNEPSRSLVSVSNCALGV
ncbi:pentatricopeptide repeat-containing protein At5g67570, chloroplastic isoform X1 [Phalaenopsis equestris]|uniref:pentatricopeptide repeat-containing protein At5g67570, chloroplastic isoform X1 n=1 Tax=Phalaenopsis equestris TaxID=78828 RepID=UPI0009E2F08E|nr:pentatricopeptide repeat-containing protein At5g67570, chloroplastic isoform X1 [Phalaenopsis equestris]